MPAHFASQLAPEVAYQFSTPIQSLRQLSADFFWVSLICVTGHESANPRIVSPFHCSPPLANHLPHNSGPPVSCPNNRPLLLRFLPPQPALENGRFLRALTQPSKSVGPKCWPRLLACAPRLSTTA